MQKRIIKMPSMEGVGAGQTATLRLPIGGTFEELLISYEGVTLPQMEEIRLIGNGKVIRRYVSGSLLNSINLFDGMKTAAGLLVLNLLRYGLVTRAGRELTSIGTGMQASEDFPETLHTFRLEIDIASDATAPKFEVRAKKKTMPAPLGPVLSVREFTYNANGQGEYEISDLPIGDIYNRLFFKSAEIERLVVETDGVVVWDCTKEENERLQKNGVRTPQSGWFVFDPTFEGYGTEFLATANLQDLRFRCYMSGSSQIGVTLESMGLLRA